jgi:hypothetical protein
VATKEEKIPHNFLASLTHTSILISVNIWAKTAKNGEEAAKLSNISLPIPLKTRG